MKVPEGWREATLGELGETYGGLSGKSSADFGEGLPYIPYMNIYSNAATDPEQLAYVKIGPKEKQNAVQRGDIFFTMSSETPDEVGISSVLLTDIGEAYLNSFCRGFRPHTDNGLVPEYAVYLFRGESFRHTMYYMAQGAIRFNLSTGRLLASPVLLPPLPEQRKIAEILGAWDEAIALVEQRLAAARARKQGLMQRLLTGQVRFPRFVRSRDRTEGRFFDIPADWQLVQVRDIGTQVSRRNGTSTSLPVLSCTKHDGLVDSLAYFGRRIYSDDTSNYKVVRQGEFAYATNHIEEGSIGLQKLHHAALISPMYTVFSLKPGLIVEYYYSLFKTELYRHIFEVNTSGTVNRRGALRWDSFALIQVPLPSPEEQRSITRVLREQDEGTNIMAAKLAALQAQKKGLMQRLLTGEVRVTAHSDERAATGQERQKA